MPAVRLLRLNRSNQTPSLASAVHEPRTLTRHDSLNQLPHHASLLNVFIPRDDQLDVTIQQIHQVKNICLMPL